MKVPRIALGEEALGSREHQVSQHRLVAGKQPQVEQSCCRREVRTRERQRLGGAQNLVTHLKPCVPERVEQGLGERGCALLAGLGVEEQHDVGIASQSHRAPAEAAHRRERDSARHPLALPCALEEEPETSVQEARVRLSESEPVVARFEPASQAFLVPQDRRPERGCVERHRRYAARHGDVHCGHLGTFQWVPRARAPTRFPLVSRPFRRSGRHRLPPRPCRRNVRETSPA